MEQRENYVAKKVNKSQVIDLEKGKIPPQAIELEEVVIGACMIDAKAFAEAYEILSDNHEVFYKQQFKYLYAAMTQMYEEDEKIDLLTVSQKLKQLNQLDLVGGDFFLIGLTQRVSSSAHMDYHCRILMQKYTQREAIKVASEIIDDAYDDSVDIFDLLEKSQLSLDNTSKWLLRKKPEDIGTSYDQLIDNLDNPKLSIPSKFAKINSRTNGYHPNDLVIIAARPGMGKTAFVLNEAKFQAENGYAVGFISLEMSSAELVGRLAANEFGIPSSRIKQNQLTDSEKYVLKSEGEKIKKLPLHIHDGSETSTLEAKSIIGSWVRKEKVRIVYVDYLQLMRAGTTAKNGNREQEIAYISRKLKAFAKEFQITVVALSQLSRAVETRGGMKRPLLSDLRESGAIEQDANVVQFLLRPEYYHIDEWDDDSRSSTKGQMEINTAKTREGETGATILGHNLKYMRIDDLDEHEEYEPIGTITESFKETPKITANDAFEETYPSPQEDEEDLPF